MGQAGVSDRLAQLRRALRRHERQIAASYLAVVVGVLLLWLVPDVRTLVSDQARKLSSWSDRQWVARVDAGVALFQAGRYDKAETALGNLDLRLPARHIKHGLASERTRVLEALARTYWAQDRKRRTLETLRRLTAFEPRNFAFHVLHGEAAAAFGEPGEAREAWARALAIEPNHLDTVRDLVRELADRGDAEGAVEAYESYLDAYGTVQLSLRGEPLSVYLPADGEWHALELGLAAPPGLFELADLTAAAPIETRGLLVETPWLAGSLKRVRVNEARSFRFLVEVRVFKPVDPELWAVVRRACRNLTDWERLERLEARTRVEAEPGDPFAGDPT